MTGRSRRQPCDTAVNRPISEQRGARLGGELAASSRFRLQFMSIYQVVGSECSLPSSYHDSRLPTSCPSLHVIMPSCCAASAPGFVTETSVPLPRSTAAVPRLSRARATLSIRCQWRPRQNKNRKTRKETREKGKKKNGKKKKKSLRQRTLPSGDTSGSEPGPFVFPPLVDDGCLQDRVIQTLTESRPGSRRQRSLASPPAPRHPRSRPSLH